MPSACHRPRRGYTLIELLIVVMIVVILVAAALPVARRVMESNRPREASRQLTAHFAMARAYAARNNRPFGLWLEYDAPVGEVDVAGNPTLRQVTRIYLAEVQPPYSGGTTGSRAIIRTEPGLIAPEFLPLTGLDNEPTGMPDGRIDQDNAELGLLRSLLDEGESFLVRFDFKGDWFRCFRGSSNFAAPYSDPLKLYYVITGTDPTTGSVSGTTAPPAYEIDTSIGYRFQILRTPRRVGNPLELTAGTCIDVEYSGFGPGGFELGMPSNRLVVLFQPSGGIDGLYGDGLTVAPTGTLHFLVGKVEKVNQPLGATPTTQPTLLNMFDLATSNLADPNSLWVSVGRQNGTATTTENVLPPVDATTLSPTNVTIFPDEALFPAGRKQNLDPTTPVGRAVFVGYCRSAATGREQMGGQ